MRPINMNKLIRILMAILIAIIVMICATPILAQQASITKYGNTCGYSPPYGSPSIVGVGLPVLGGTVDISQAGVVDRVIPYCHYKASLYLMLGASNTQLGPIPLPFTLPKELTTATNCNLYNSMDFVFPQNNPAGVERLSIPNSVNLLGVNLYAQWAVFFYTVGPSCPSPLNYAMVSDCLKISIGV